MSYTFKTKPFEHQKKALDLSAFKRNFAYFMEMGCVDGETEFLTQRGWIKFEDFDLDKWERPLLVAAGVPTNDPARWGFKFVEPETFICKESGDWYALRTKDRGMSKDQETEFLMTGEHTLPIEYEYTVHTGRMNESRHVAMPNATVEYLYKVKTKDPTREPKLPADDTKLQLRYAFSMAQGLQGFESKYFSIENNEIAQLTPEEIRFMVAVAADGTYPNVNDNKVDFYFTKDRKCKRIQELAVKAGIPLAYERKAGSKYSKKPIHVFHAIAPAKCKVFDSRWYSLNSKQLFAVASEIFYWDGHIDSSCCEFYTIHKESATFVQYALTACGWPARIRYQESKKLYRVIALKSTCWHNDVTPEGFSARDEMFMKKWKTFDTIEKVPVRMTSYCFRVPTGYLILRRNGNIFVSGNSGKSKVMIDNIGILYDKEQITGALVLAPKGVYRNWYSKEIPTHLSDSIEREVLIWDAASTQSKKDKLKKQIEKYDGSCLQILVFNIESLVSEKGKSLLSLFIKKHKGKVLALVDESTCIKNHKAKRTKAAIELGKKCIARRIATGSPVTNSPLDLFSQCAFLDKGLLGFGSFYAFKNTYANIEKVMNRQGQSYEKILSYKNLDDLSKKIEAFSFRVTKKECLDLPDKVYVTRDVEITPEQRQIYMDLSNHQFAFLEKDGEFQEMSTQVILTKFLRLHQVLCGSFVSDDGTIYRIPNNRLTALRETLDEVSGKVIIWATYLEDIRSITEMLEKEYGKETFVTYFGETSSEDRTKAIELFQDPGSPVRFFVGNVQTAGRGITLTEASTVIYYSNNFSLELRQQSEDRAHRFGQKNKVTYIDLVIRNTLDEKIIRALIEKRNIANEILKDDLESWISLSGV